MHAASMGSGVLHRIDQHRVSEKTSIGNRVVDAGDVHVHNPTGTDVEMAHLAVAHLPVGQSYKMI